MKIPRIGDIISVGSHCYLSHGRDDFVGGQATVTHVVWWRNLGRMVPFVIIKEAPSHRYNWEMLEPAQEQLKQEFGEQWAHPDPDLRPEFNDDFW
jgi:hypothetical protein